MLQMRESEQEEKQQMQLKSCDKENQLREMQKRFAMKNVVECGMGFVICEEENHHCAKKERKKRMKMSSNLENNLR